MNGTSYADAGVNYELLDAFKRQAQIAARETAWYETDAGFSPVEWIHGESASLKETPGGYLAHVNEGLGTKCLVADRFRRQIMAAGVERLQGKSFYDALAQDTVAMIVNDMITAGALPSLMAMHLAVGSDEWFKDEQRSRDLINGWKGACHLAGCEWGGGETAVLKDIVLPEAALLSGSAVGIITNKKKVIRPSLQDGDAIVMLASAGIHANGLTLVRRIAEKLPDGYLTELPDGTVFGESLLRPTVIYVPMIRGCVDDRVRQLFLHYAVNITGHGWRKLMRAEEPFVYVIEKLPAPSPLFAFLQERGPISDEEAYATFNMGAGFALFMPPDNVDYIVSLARGFGIDAWQAGHVEKRGDEKKVVIVPKGLEYPSETLAIR